MLQTAKQVGDQDYKKSTSRPTRWIPQFLKKWQGLTLVDCQLLSVLLSGGELEPKQLTYKALAPVATSTAQTTSPRSTVAREESIRSEGRTKWNLTVLQVQLSTAREELNNLKQQDQQFFLLCSIQARMCTVCHVTGHMKTTCKNEACTNISCCKVREKHPEHRANIQQLQRPQRILNNKVQTRKLISKVSGMCANRPNHPFLS